jgi:hypothetical protein
VLYNPIPENTAFHSGKHYDADMNAIYWEGTLWPGETTVASFTVTIDPGVPSGTIITNEAFLTDDATGDSASVSIETK